MQYVFDNRPSESPLVAWVWQTQSEEAGKFISQASNQCEMVISTYQGQTNITFRGPETAASAAEGPADAEFLGIVFKPGVYMPSFPVNTLVNNTVTLPNATGRSFWLNGAVWKLPTFENADTFIHRLTRDGLLTADPVVTGSIAGEPQYISPRALQYRFLRATGMTQATFKQIERARTAASLLIQGRSISDVVYEMGYFDQAHMTRSFRRFIGQTPAQVISPQRLIQTYEPIENLLAY